MCIFVRGMGKKIFYILIRLFARIPLSVQYVFSDIFLYPLVYYVVGYRKKIFRENIRSCFPGWDIRKQRRMEHRFYRHFCNLIPEIVHAVGMRPGEAKKRIVYENLDLLRRFHEQGKGVFVLLGHYGNWEYQNIKLLLPDIQVINVYRPLKNNVVDYLMLRMRSQYGARNVPKKDVLRELVVLKKQREAAIFGMISDQTPSRANLHYWTRFLNRDTPMLTGVERMARKMDYAVVYAHVSVMKRGYYRTEFRLLTEDAVHTAPFEITEKYARMMEENILQDPSYWLWTHRRWKYKRTDKG